MRLFIFLFLTCVLPAFAQDATPVAKPPLSTRWAKDVNPNAPWPEYPRPLLTRPDWMSLNGRWQFEELRPGPPPRGRDLKGTVLVPFPIEAPLSGVGKHIERVWYRRTFEVPAAWKGRRIMLRFEAVNWEAGVYLNGKLAGAHRGGYDPFAFDVTDDLQDGANELLVGAVNNADWGEQPRGKQVNNPEGASHTAATGIWQSVWLEPVPPARIENLVVTPDVDTSSFTFKVEAVGAEGDVTQVEIFDGGQRVAMASGVANTNLRVAVPNAKLWSPGQPFLHDVKVTLLHDGKAVDSVGSYAALRKISLGFDEKNRQRILLNGQFLFQVGVLDQGYWPDGVYTAPTDEALRFDIETARKLGFNAIRKRAKIEPQRWYYWADRLGILVWQDMPGGGNNSPKGKKQFETELRRLVETRRGHPSIIQWILFNEGWGQFDIARLTQMVKTLDPTRLVTSSSGSGDAGVGDIVATHNTPSPEARPPEPTRASVSGAFGGLGLVVQGHFQAEKPHGTIFNDPALLARHYDKVLVQAWKLKDEPGASGVIYSQLTDVEAEASGLLTYDRAVQKIAAERIVRANRGEAQVAPLTLLVPTAKEAKDAPAEWKYTTDNPGENWMAPDFDDAAWKSGPGGFGKDTPGVRTEWKTPDIWLRRVIELPANVKTPLFLIQHDEDADVYVNGVLAAQAKGYSGDYGEFALAPEARAALKPGKNLLAVHAHNGSGASFIDVGLGQIE